MPTYFALSWCITWFAHDVDAPAAQARIFDLCIAFPPPMILYLCTAVGRFETTERRERREWKRTMGEGKEGKEGNEGKEGKTRQVGT